MRTRWGQLAAPLPLRLVLGITFLWAGLGKIEGEFAVQGDTAATLASMGVDRLREEGQRNLRAGPQATSPATPSNQPAGGPPPTSTPTTNPTTEEPSTVPSPSSPPSGPPSGLPVGPPLPTEAPSTSPTTTPANPVPLQEPPSPLQPPEQIPEQIPGTQTSPSAEQPSQIGQPTQTSPSQPLPPTPRAAVSRPLAMPMLAQVTAPPATPDPSSMGGKGEMVYHAGLFTQPVSIKRLYRISLLIHRAGNPAVSPAASLVASPNSSPVAMTTVAPRKLLPNLLTKGSRPVAIAWMLAIGEVIVGVLLLIGLLTRISASWCACVMLSAIWLTEIGPAIQSSSTMLGFLPKRDLWEAEGWKSLLWQCSLLASSLALAFMGSGWLGLDKRLFPDAPPTPSRPRPMM